MSVEPLSGKALQAVRYSTASINAYEGSVRSGKTFAAMLMWMRYARTGPPGPLLMVGRTQRTVKHNLIDPMTEMLGEKRCRYIEGKGELWLFGRKVYVVGADNESSVTKIQGLTLAGACVDECATIPESFFNMLYSRLSVEDAQLWLTSNPEGPQHWLKVNWLDRARVWIDGSGRVHENADGIDLHRVTFKLDDNPHLPDEYVQRTKYSYTGLFYRRYVNAEWVAAEGAIYDMWDPARHVVEWSQLPTMTRMLALGVDHGTTNPTSGVLVGLGEDGRLYLVDEFRYEPKRDAHRLSDAQLSSRMREWMGQPHLPNQASLASEYVVVDPAAASFRVQLYRDGLTSIPANNDVLRGISVTSNLLAHDQLLVSDRCEGFITEAPGYAWDDKATERGEDKPIGVADHSLDSCRYGLLTTEPLWRPHLAPAA